MVWHRVSFYQGQFSNFDSILPCKHPKFCYLCVYKHPFCAEDGKVISQQHQEGGDAQG